MSIPSECASPDSRDERKSERGIPVLFAVALNSQQRASFTSRSMRENVAHVGQPPPLLLVNNGDERTTLLVHNDKVTRSLVAHRENFL